MRPRETERASQAAGFIARIKGHKDAADIRKEIEALPARIRINGLLQTLIYLLEMEKGDRLELGKVVIAFLTGEKDEKKLTRTALNLCIERLREATEDAYAFAYWLKLMAKAELPKDSPAEGSSDETAAAGG